MYDGSALAMSVKIGVTVFETGMANVIFVGSADYVSLEEREVLFEPATAGDPQNVTVVIMNDVILENDETFFVVLTTRDPDVLFGIDTAVVTIVDEDGKL